MQRMVSASVPSHGRIVPRQPPKTNPVTVSLAFHHFGALSGNFWDVCDATERIHNQHIRAPKVVSKRIKKKKSET